MATVGVKGLSYGGIATHYKIISICIFSFRSSYCSDTAVTGIGSLRPWLARSSRLPEPSVRLLVWWPQHPSYSWSEEFLSELTPVSFHWFALISSVLSSVAY